MRKLERAGFKAAGGSILMETVLVMPILFFLVFGIIQFSLVWMAQQFTEYAAFCAARSLLVSRSGTGEQARIAGDAAKLALSWMCLADEGQTGVSVPGWGVVKGAGTVDRRVAVRILDNGENPATRAAAVEVRFLFPLMIPGMAVNKVIANFAGDGKREGRAEFFGDLDKAAGSPQEIAGWPYLRLTAACSLPMPYSTANFPAGGFAGASLK